MKELINNHERIVLLFSGGVDSLACFYHLKKYWNEIAVMWVNTGDAFPETINQMDYIKSLVANFIEVKSDQKLNIDSFGYPADIISAWQTESSSKCIDSLIKLQSPMDCCRANLWEPAHNAILKYGATLVLTGQRNSDSRKSQFHNGQEVNGITYGYPIAEWSREDAINFLKENNIEVPAHYDYMDTSLDCMHCTAYADESKGKLDYMLDNHPLLHKEFKRRIEIIVNEAQNQINVVRGNYCA